MKILTKKITKDIFKQEGCWTTQTTLNQLDNIIEEIITDIATKSKIILESWKRKVLTKEALEIAYDRHKQSQVANITQNLITKLQTTLEKEGEEIATQYRKGSQLNTKTTK